MPTNLTPQERFANHKKGYKKNYKLMKYGVKLLPELYQHLNPMTYDEACRMEKVLAIETRLAESCVIARNE